MARFLYEILKKEKWFRPLLKIVIYLFYAAILVRYEDITFIQKKSIYYIGNYRLLSFF